MTGLQTLSLASCHLRTMIKLGCPIEELKEFNLYIERIILSLTDEEVNTTEFNKCNETMKNNLTLLQEFYLTN